MTRPSLITKKSESWTQNSCFITCIQVHQVYDESISNPKYFLESINKILYLRQTSFALLKSIAASIKRDAPSSLILTLQDYNLIISRISKVMSDARRSMRATKDRRKCPQVLIRRRRILY